MTLTKSSGKAVKKPISVEFYHWTGQPPHVWPDWMRHNLAVRYEVTNLQLDTKMGTVRCNRGDVVLRAPDGEVYPCKLSTFEETYDTVE